MTRSRRPGRRLQLIERKQHSNSRPPAQLTLSFDAAAVQLRDVFDDGKSQTGSTEFAAAGFVGAIKALENTRQIIFAEPDSITAHADHDSRSPSGALQANASIL